MFKTKADLLIELLEVKKEVSLDQLPKLVDAKRDVVSEYLRILEEAGIVSVAYTPRAVVRFVKNPDTNVEFRDEKVVLNRMKILLEMDDLKELKKLFYELYNASQQSEDPQLKRTYANAHEFLLGYLKDLQTDDSKTPDELIRELEHYTLHLDRFVMNVKIVKQSLEMIPYYLLSIVEYGPATQVVLDVIKEDVVRSITLDTLKEQEYEEKRIREEFRTRLRAKLEFLLSELPEANLKALSEYITLTALGMGDLEILLHDPKIEEIVVNNADEPVMIYHGGYGWLKTNIIVDSEDTIKHYSTIAGRLVNKNITLLSPLLDAHLSTGDRVNATLEPISTKGNTLTIRKFASNPWTITRLLTTDTIDYETAALVWLCVQYELSMIIVGGTGSGKTSTLNVISNFLQPNQRVVSIEDTRELVLPDSLHWVPLQSRLPNPEGEGGISMLDLVVNSLRMRPDRILVGEIRRKEEAEVMFEAMHTGHSVYATLHANTVAEAIQRLTNPPIDLPKNVLNSLSLLIVQNRNRRTGTRKTFQVAEIMEDGSHHMLYEYDIAKDSMRKVDEPKRLYETLRLFTGLTKERIVNDLAEKKRLLKYIVENEIDDVHKIGYLISDYYSNETDLFERLFAKTDGFDAGSSKKGGAKGSESKSENAKSGGSKGGK